MSAILKRAHNVLLITVAMVFGLTLLAPLATLANTDLTVGEQATIDNPKGNGANLRSDIKVLDESTLIAELPQGVTVTITGGPTVVDSGAYYWVTTIDGAEGLVSASLLSSVADTEVEPTEVETTQPTSQALLRQEPIDVGFVVDDNNEIPVEGLACRATATVDGEVVTRVAVNASLQVVGPRIVQGDLSFVQINCADGSGYVNGANVALESESAPVVTEPVVADEQVVDEPIVTEPVVAEPVVDEPIVDEPVVDEPVVDEPIVDEPVVDEPVVDEPVTEEIVGETVVEAPVVDEPAIDEQVVDEPMAEEVIEESAVEAPVVDASVTDEPVAKETVSKDSDVGTSETVVENPLADDAATDVPETDAPVVDESIDDAAPAEPALTTQTESATDEVIVTDVASSKAEVTEEAVVEEESTSDVTEPVDTEDATGETTARVEATAPEPVAPAVTAPASDISEMIGSATVTGTNGEGLRCRVAPDDSAATLMLLDEGTKVYVLSEADNGYLGIDCGGLQGFADVNFLWSGGAGDGEIQKSSMTLLVAGTGNGLNCRTGASTSYPVITVLPDGTALTTRAAASNGWVAVVCGGQNGFVATPYVSAASGGGESASSSSDSISGSVTVTGTNGEGLYCRTGAGSSYSVITVLSPGQSVSVRGANQGSWTPINCGGMAGFAHSDYLSAKAESGSTTPAPSNPTPGASTGTVTVANTDGAGLNCRSGAGTSFGVITVLRFGQTIDARSGSTSGWQAVVCGGQNGFVSADFISSGSTSTPEEPKDPAPTPAPGPSGLQSGDHGHVNANLNLRYDASLGSGVAAVAPEGTVVLITGGSSNGFFPVDWDGLKGYMSGDYLTKTSAALSQRGGSADPGTTAPPSNGGGTATGNAMVDYAMAYLGYPYVWATHGPASFDCSGFTYWVTKNVVGKDIGYGTWTQVSSGARVSRANLQPGDLVFFQNTYTAGLSHVGLYIGNGKFIHAENENTGVRISDLDSSYYGSRWYGAVRL